jgi:hypothetical protein
MVKTCAFLAAGAAAFQSCEPVFNNLRPPRLPWQWQRANVQ